MGEMERRYQLAHWGMKQPFELISKKAKEKKV